MNRLRLLALSVAILLSALATPASAFDPSRSHHGNRIGVLLMSQRAADSSEMHAAEAVRGALTEELRKAGFDAFDTGARYDQLSRRSGEADYYVEVLSSAGEMHENGVATLDDGRVGADVGILVLHVAAQLRLYDGESLELVDRFRRGQAKNRTHPQLRRRGWSARLLLDGAAVDT